MKRVECSFCSGSGRLIFNDQNMNTIGQSCAPCAGTGFVSISEIDDYYRNPNWKGVFLKLFVLVSLYVLFPIVILYFSNPFFRAKEWVILFYIFIYWSFAAARLNAMIRYQLLYGIVVLVTALAASTALYFLMTHWFDFPNEWIRGTTLVTFVFVVRLMGKKRYPEEMLR